MHRTRPILAHNNRGFTLIELLLYVSLVGALLGGIVVFFGVMSESRVKNQSISEVNQQGQFIMDTITHSIRNADSVTAPAAGTSAASLTATVPTASLSPTLFTLSSATVQIKEGAAAAIALNSNKVQATAITFKNVSRTGTPGAIQVSLTLARANANNRAEYDYTRTFITTVSLRP